MLIRYGCLLDTPVSMPHFGPYPSKWQLLDSTLASMNKAIFQLLNAARTFTNKQLHSCYSCENPRIRCVHGVFKALGKYASNPANLTYLCHKTVRDVLRAPLPISV